MANMMYVYLFLAAGLFAIMLVVVLPICLAARANNKENKKLYRELGIDDHA